MCGIWGRYESAGPPLEADELLRMGRALRHRGPDETGSFVSGRVGLGVHRLRVIDLVSGSQPVSSEDGSITAVMNGEIYNFRELREALQARGHRFRGGSDTEVIVHLYEDDPDGCWARLNGMFAIALWDAPRRLLRLARDPLGVKPLYYAAGGGRAHFASELKPLLSTLGAEVDLASLSDYLSLNYVPGPRTILRGVRQLPAGQVLTCDAGAVSLRSYREVQWRPRRWTSPHACEDAVLDAARQAVRRQMVSDVPLGALLSGGVDSSLLVALLARESSRPIETFSVGFREPAYDESPFARQVSRLYRTSHHEILCDPAASAAWLPSLAHYADQLCADPSLVPTYLVCREARKAVTVVLSGDGGDELFAGYPTYQADRLLAWYRRVPDGLHRVLLRAARRLPPSTAKLGFSYRAQKFLEGARLDADRAHAWWRTVFTDEDKARLFHPDVWAMVSEHDPFEAAAPWFAQAGSRPHWLDRYQYADLHTWLADDVLAKVDRMSMAHALEARVPWLDLDLVELALSIPPAWRLRGFQTKWLLKRAARRLLPREVIYRKKSGFLPAIGEWLHGPWKPLVGDELSRDSVRRLGWLDPDAVQQLLREHWGGQADHSFKIWNLLMLVWWRRMAQAQGTGCEEAPCEKVIAG